jgi:chromosome segregation ATPase
MEETLEKDGNRIDRASQVILRALNGGDEWVRGKTLREAADLSQNGQVFYRMEEHLIPSGLAQEAARTERNGHVEPRQFRLTEEGGAWVDEHADTLAIPTTREEAAEKAGAAYEAAESARSSVQNYRKKLHRVKSRVEEIEEQQETHHTGLSNMWQQSENTRERSEETAAAVEELQEQVGGIEESVSELEEEVSSIERRMSEESERREESLREDLEEVREQAERANRSWWERLFSSD